MDPLIKKSEFAKIENISRGRVSQLLKMGVIKQTDTGHLRARESIEALALYRHRPRRKPSNDSHLPELEIDLGEALKSLERSEPKTREKR